jgi:hypothetical protein
VRERQFRAAFDPARTVAIARAIVAIGLGEILDTDFNETVVRYSDLRH